MFDKILLRLFYREKFPIRFLIIKLINKFNIGNYFFRLKIGATKRPYYGNIIFEAAKLGKALGHKKISIVEETMKRLSLFLTHYDSL